MALAIPESLASVLATGLWPLDLCLVQPKPDWTKVAIGVTPQLSDFAEQPLEGVAEPETTAC
jgi:hypothetical protein